MKSVLVTGHRGLLGSACVRVLTPDYRVLIYSDNLVDESGFRRWMLENHPDYVVHCAAKVGGVKSNRDNPVDFLSENLKIQSSVINSAADFDVQKLVFIGTSCLYPRDCDIPVKEDSLLTGPFEPDVEAYATAKLAGYALCKAHRHQYGRNFVTVCPSNLYGIGDNYGPSSHVIPSLIWRLSESIKNKTPLVVWGDGTAVREFLYADDAADAIKVVLESSTDYDIINIGTGVGTTIANLVDLLVWVAGAGTVVEWDTSQPSGIPKKTFDISRMESLGWSPKTSLAWGLGKTWDNFNLNPNPRFK